MIAVSILLCLVGTSALGYLHVTQPTASAIEKKAKKTKEFQVQAAAYEAALKNINNPNSSKGTAKPGDKK